MFILKKARKLDGKIDFNGLPISIETGRSRIRQWFDPHSDRSGMTLMRYPYGYVKGSLGQDGEAVDVYVGPHRNASNVYIVNQMKAPDFAEHDEQKVMLGFKTGDEAREAYLRHYDDQRFLGSIITMSFEEFKEKVLTSKGQKLEKSRFDFADDGQIQDATEKSILAFDELCKAIRS